MKSILSLLSALALAVSAPLSAHAEVSPTSIDGATTVDTAQARQLFDQGVAFVDVRKDSDWEAGRVPGAIHLELKKVYSSDALAEEVQKDEPLVLYCNGEKCLRSSDASQKAVEWGWTKVHYYRDGFPAWKAASLPVE